MFKNDGYNHIIANLGMAETVDITDPLFKIAVAQGEIKVVQSTGIATGHIVVDSNSAAIFLIPTIVDTDGAIAEAITITLSTGAIGKITAS